MKQLTAIVALVLALVACKSKNNESNTANQIHKEWYGNWVGDFDVEEYKQESNYVYRTKVNIRIISINKNGTVIGQSIVAGNKRALKGSFDEGIDKFILKEPGNNKYDGVFEFVIIGDSLVGSWVANNKTIDVTKRSFRLVQKQFVYNKMLMLPSNVEEEIPRSYIDSYSSKDTILTYKGDSTIEGDSSYEYVETLYRVASTAVTTINASTKELKEADLKNLKKLDLEIIRNTIYARHGFTFGKKSVRQFFDFVEWYVPISDNVESQLTPLEVKNIALLKRFEKYAEDNYDTFGR
ncbi:MAG: YARHG domain-containing protein [Flavobacterium sp.]|nr:YARHG domain-containing protein [Flavobacterium sp.]